ASTISASRGTVRASDRASRSGWPDPARRGPPPRSGRNGFEPPPGHRRSKPAADDEHHPHGAGDEGEYAGGAVMAEQEGDDEAGEDRRKPAPRIDKAHRLGADASRIELGLIGMERERHPIVAQRDQ